MKLKPKVTLVNHTHRPADTIIWAFKNMHNPIPNYIPKVSTKEKTDFLNFFSKQPHQTCFEYINLVFKLENVSRAFQQQLTRTRDASYCIQSLRVVEQKDFATKDRYTMPDKKKYTKKQVTEFNFSMKSIEELYKHLLEIGFDNEDARGILPLNIHSPITLNINFRSLIHTLELRLCKNTQGEYAEVARQIKKEVTKKLGCGFGDLLQPICEHSKECNSAVPCGKYPSIIKEDVSIWIKG